MLCLLLASLTVTAAPIWQEAKIGNLAYVTFESFCEFYEFNKPAVSESDLVNVSGVYGRLTLRSNSREAWFDGRRVWLSFPFVRDEQGNGFVSRLDVIKLFDPLLRRSEAAPRQKALGVVIDAGHGGSDNGTRSRANYFEKIAALDTAKRLEAILKAGGIATFMTRTEDVFIPLPERSNLANQRGEWIFVSLHYNEAGTAASGIETFCLSPRYSPSTSDGGNLKHSDREPQPGNKNDPLNIILADSIHAEVAKLHPEQGDRGIKRARFLVLKNTEIPAVLVEGGFLSNSGDAKLITTGAYRQQLAEAVARGVKNYIALMNSAPTRPPTVIKPAPEQPQFRQPAAPPLRVPVVPNLNEITREVADDTQPPESPAPPPLEEIVPDPEPDAPAAPAEHEREEPEHGRAEPAPEEASPSAAEPSAAPEPPPSAPEQPAAPEPSPETPKQPE